jgi:hypothetical protein
MIIDLRATFGQVTPLPTGALGRFNVGDNIDLDGPSISPNTVRTITTNLCIVVQVMEAITSLGAATVQFHLVSDDTNSIATDGSASEHFASGPIPVAALGAGRRVYLTLPGATVERFLAMQCTVAGDTLTGGVVAMLLTDTTSDWTPYANDV